MNAGYRDSCCPLFEKLNVLLLYSQHTFELSAFVVKNTDVFKSTSATHRMNTRQGFDLHPPTTNLTKAQKLKFFSNLPLNIKQLSHDTKNLNWLEKVSSIRIFLLL